MKRLMVAAALMALGGLNLQADTVIDSVNFNDRATGTFNWTEPDVVGSGETLWSRGTDVTEIGDNEVKKYATPPTEGNTKYLKIDESGVLARKLAEEAVTIPANGGIRISSRVQFTAQDAEDAAPEVADGSKIALWAQIGEGVTNLMVTAGQAIGDTTKTNIVTNFKLSNDKDAWYDLVVKSENGDNGAVFTITVDGTDVTSEDGAMTTFQSLVALGETGYASIASLGFKGTGAADELEFASYENETAIEVTLTFDPEESQYALDDDPTYAVDGGVKIPFDASTGFSILPSQINESITIEANADGYKPYSKTYTKAEFVESEGALTIKMEPASEDPTTAEGLQLLITDAEAGVETTIKLGGNITMGASALQIAADKVIVLDLQGYTLQNSAAGYTIVNAGALTIVDTAEEKGTITHVTADTSSTIRNLGTLTISDITVGGNYIGIKNDEGAGCNGGKGYGELTLNGVTFNGGDQAVQNWGHATLNGGTYGGAVYTWAYAGNEGNVAGVTTIEGGTFNAKVAAVQMYDTTLGWPSATATVTINGGTFEEKVFGTYTTDYTGDDPEKGVISVPTTSSAQFKVDETPYVTLDAGYKFKQNLAGYYQVAAIEYATLTITAGENVSDVVVTNAAGDVVTAETKFDKDNATVVAVKSYTIADGFELDADSSVLTVTLSTDAEIKVIAKAKAPAGFSVIIAAGENVTGGKFTIGNVTNDFSSTAVLAQDGDTVKIITVNYALGYQQNGEYIKGWSTTANDDISITVTATAVQGGGAEPELPADVTPAEAGITNEAFANATPTEVKSVVKWQASQGNNGANINAAQFDTDPTTGAVVAEDTQAEAFLLDCAPTAVAIEAAEASFKISAFTPGQNPTIGEQKAGDSYGNGKLQLLGATEVDGTYAPNTEGAKFFKYQLVKEAENYGDVEK